MENTQKKTIKQLLEETMEREDLLSKELERKIKESSESRKKMESLLDIRDAKVTESAIAAAGKGENDFIALSSCVKNLELDLDLERDNEKFYREELAKEVLIGLSEKYKGKKAGVKTLGKIYEEFREKSGFFGQFKRRLYSQKSDLFQLPDYRGREFYLTSAMGKSFINENNFIQPLDESSFCVSEKQPTRNTQERFDKLKEAERKLEEARNNYNSAAGLYNSLKPFFYNSKSKIY